MKFIYIKISISCDEVTQCRASVHHTIIQSQNPNSGKKNLTNFETKREERKFRD